MISSDNGGQTRKLPQGRKTVHPAHPVGSRIFQRNVCLDLHRRLYNLPCLPVELEDNYVENVVSAGTGQDYGFPGIEFSSNNLRLVDGRMGRDSNRTGRFRPGWKSMSRGAEMRVPVRERRDVILNMFGIGYYMPANVYERIYAAWESMVTRLKFRLFIIRDKVRYARKRRSTRASGRTAATLPLGGRPDVW